MNFGQAIAAGFRNYVNFTARASRSEYWYWLLFNVIVSVAASLLDLAIFPVSHWGPLSSVWTLVVLLPAISISVRRLHDIDRTGWWVLLNFTIVGIFVLIFWACIKGTSGPNRFGADPLGSAVTRP